MQLTRNKNIRSNLLFITLVFAAATIPLSNNLNSIAVVSFVIACVLQQPLKVTVAQLKKSRFWLLPVIYYLWYAWTFFWDTSGGFTIKHLEHYAILLFIPPAVAIIPLIDYRRLKYACIAFIAVTIVVCIICLVKSYNEYKITGDYRVFYYHYLAGQMDLNAIFLSNFCLASVVWLFYFGKNRMHLLYKIPLAAFLVTMIFFLSSKMVLLLLLLAVPGFIIYYIRPGKNLVRSAIGVLLFVIAGILAINKLPYLKWRIQETKFKKYEGNIDNQNGVAIRLFMWNTGWKLIKERPLLGYGIKGAREETLKQYKEKGFTLGYEAGYHTHNQYIESTLMAGIPALIILLLIIGISVWKGLADNNVLLLAGALHFAIHSLIEATFEVQQELVFFMLFIFLFYYHPPKQKLPARNV